MDALVIGQIAASAALGSVLGWEREFEAQRAGLRTHILVAVGATLFTVAGTGIGHTDPTRIAAQVVSGIGFLGAGAILREGLNVHGLTTAATLWLTAAIGLAVGLEAWTAAVAATVTGVVVLQVLKRVEEQIAVSRPTVLVTVDIAPGIEPSAVTREIADRVPGVRAVRVQMAATGAQMRLVVRPDRGESVTALCERLMAVDGLTSVRVGG